MAMQRIDSASTATPVRACNGRCDECPCLRLLAETEPDAHRAIPIDRAPRPDRSIEISRASHPRRTIPISRAPRANLRALPRSFNGATSR